MIGKSHVLIQVRISTHAVLAGSGGSMTEAVTSSSTSPHGPKSWALL
jgi:hypothetical protein